VEREDAPSSVQTQTGADSSCNASLIITLGAVAASGIASEIRNRVKTRYLPDTAALGNKVELLILPAVVIPVDYVLQPLALLDRRL